MAIMEQVLTFPDFKKWCNEPTGKAFSKIKAQGYHTHDTLAWVWTKKNHEIECSKPAGNCTLMKIPFRKFLTRQCIRKKKNKMKVQVTIARKPLVCSMCGMCQSKFQYIKPTDLIIYGSPSATACTVINSSSLQRINIFVVIIYPVSPVAIVSDNCWTWRWVCLRRGNLHNYCSGNNRNWTIYSSARKKM